MVGSCYTLKVSLTLREVAISLLNYKTGKEGSTIYSITIYIYTDSLWRSKA